MGAIENIASAESFQAGAVYGNTAEYRSVKRDLSDVADRLTGLLGNMGIEGQSADAIDQSLTALITNIRERSDNVDQLADARNTATQGGSSAGQRSQMIQPDANFARQLMLSPDEQEVMRGEQMLIRLEIEANTALRTLETQTEQAIQELPVVFPEDTASSAGGGAEHSNRRSTQTSAQYSPGYATRPPQSATQWIPQHHSIDTTPMGPGSRASFTAAPAAHAPTDPLTFTPQPTVQPGAVAESVSQPVHSGFPSANEGFMPQQGTATAAVNVPYTPSQSDDFGIGAARAAAGAAALPAMAKAVTRAQSAMGGAPRGGGGASARTGAPAARGAAPRAGASPRASGGASPRAGAPAARGAAPRAGMPARGGGSASPRSGATTRAGSGASRGGLAPRAGQGAATRAGTPARTASARGTGAARTAGAGSAKTGTAARGTAARGTAARGATSSSRATAASRSAGSQGRGAPVARGGVTAPRQGAAGSGTGRGMAGRPMVGTGRKKSDAQQGGHDTFTAAELQDNTTITFIEAGFRED